MSSYQPGDIWYSGTTTGGNLTPNLTGLSSPGQIVPGVNASQFEWQPPLPRPAMHLSIDAQGRVLVHGGSLGVLAIAPAQFQELMALIAMAGLAKLVPTEAASGE